MKIIVQKFGGTSLTTSELRTKVCDIVQESLTEGYRVVVVVSAIGRKGSPYATDTLIGLLQEVNPEPDLRELDLMMSCGETLSGILLSAQMQSMDIPAQFMSGAQAGIVTDQHYGDARILYVNPQRVLSALQVNRVLVVAGFQGISEEGEITTLGRGGSDTTACALGAALQAECVDIFTDVEGVMTADPRIVSNARLLNSITYNEICQLARDGAKVVHPRAVEIAMHKNIPLRIRSTFTRTMGTLVNNGLSEKGSSFPIRDMTITGVTYMSSISQFRIDQQQEQLENKVFSALAAAKISVDFVSIRPEHILFTVNEKKQAATVKVLKALSLFYHVETDCAKIAVVGAAMTGIPGVISQVIDALSRKQIPILQTGDSYTSIWCLVPGTKLEIALQTLHDEFRLEQEV